MYANKVMMHFTKQINVCFTQIDMTMSKMLNDIAKKIVDLYGKVEKNLKAQAYWNVVTGLGGAACSFGSAFSPGPEAQKTMEAWSQVFRTGQQGGEALLRAKGTEYSYKADNAKTNEMQEARTAKDSMDQTRQRMMDKVFEVQEKENKGYESR